MGARQCINAKAKLGKVNQDQAQAASDLYDEQLAALNAANVPNAAMLAEQRTLAGLKASKLARQRATIAQMTAQESIRARLAGHGANTGDAAMALLDFDPANKFKGANVVQMGHDIENQAFARMEGIMRRFRARFANVDKLPTAAREARRATMRQVVRELFGEDSGSAEAKAYAEGASSAMEYSRALFNASGGSIRKLEKWGLPTSHNRRLLASIIEPGIEQMAPAARAARKAEIWTDYVMQRLDRKRMLDFHTGLPLTEPGLRRLLGHTYENIVTGGLSEVKPGVSGSGDFLGRRQQARFLMFKDADSWMEYQERFGEEAPFDTIIHHIRSMSRDTATLRVLGYNPLASVRYVEKLIAQGQGTAALQGVGKTAARLAGNLFGKAERFRRLYDLTAGNINSPGNSTFAAIDESNRNVLQSAILGGAALSAISDRAFTWATASLLDVPNGRVLTRFLKSLSPASIEDQALALRVGFGAEDMLGAMISENRYTGEIFNPSISRTLADSVMRASGLVRLTTAGRQAFQVEFLGELTRLRNRGFEDLTPGMRRGFDLYDITKADWETFRKMQPWKDPKSGAEFLRPHDLIGDPSQIKDGPLFQRRFDLANKFMSMINAERDFAIPSTSTRMRADILAGTRPGTLGGFVTRNVATLKSFPLTLMYMHMNRMILGQLPRMTRAKFAAQTIIGASVLGALGAQMGNIALGKDPQDMTDPKFWLKAAAKGGGAGIFGDLIFGDQSRIGSFTDYVLGPVLSEEIPKGLKLTVGTAQQLVTTGTTKGKGKELVDFSRLMTPGRSLWYSSLAADRLIFDEVQAQIDPDYAASFARREEAARRESGQEFFSPPGSGFPPQRAPNFAPALGNP